MFFLGGVLQVAACTVAMTRPGRSAARNRQPVVEVDSDDGEDEEDE